VRRPTSSVWPHVKLMRTIAMRTPRPVNLLNRMEVLKLKSQLVKKNVNQLKEFVKEKNPRLKQSLTTKLTLRTTKKKTQVLLIPIISFLISLDDTASTTFNKANLKNKLNAQNKNSKRHRIRKTEQSKSLFKKYK